MTNIEIKLNIMKSQKFRKRCGSSTTHNRTYKILVIYNEDPYWDEGYRFYPRYRVGYKNPIKRLLSFQVRMYKTWKYNRKTQWK